MSNDEINNEISIEDFISDQFEKIPEQMREIIASSNFIEKTREIGKKQNLSGAGTNKLIAEFIIFLFGASHPADFLTLIQEQIPCSEEKAISIFNDINNEIFEPMIKAGNGKGIEPILKATPEQEDEFRKSGHMGLVVGLIDDIENIEKISEEENMLVERSKLAPDFIRNLLTSQDFVMRIKNIGSKFNLTEKNLSEIETELVLELLTNFSQFKIDNIKSGLEERGNINKDILPEVITSIEKEILNPIKVNIDQKIKSFRENLERKFGKNC